MSKKLLSLTLAICVALSLFAGMTFSASAEVEGLFQYDVSGGEAAIYGYSDAFDDEEYGGSLMIPDTVGEDIPVTQICGEGFANYTSFTSLSIPSTVEYVGPRAFENATSLTTVAIFSPEVEIDDNAFAGCSAISSVYFFGTEQQAGNLSIGNGNDYLIDAEWYITDYGQDEVEFPDVNYDEWYGDAVEFVYYSNLMTGYANGKFGTTDSIQRQDFVIILSRIWGGDLSEYEGQKAFKDVDPKAYYAPALAWAKANGISSGYNDGSFGVGKKVTREQIMTFFHNFVKWWELDVTVSDAEKAQIRAQYSDFKNVSSYAQEATYWALKNGVISGKDVNGKRYISPGTTAMRCEVAAMLYNIYVNDILPW
ncbi:MAG: S-layer homology domain-containing protein [Clostridia bacterium]|nr:S-layer homology domain-containing protein [Clostridia bacterium]